jgi:hypothetical protein
MPSEETLQAIDAKLAQLQRRQEAIILAVNANTDSIGILAAKMEEVVAWMNEPPSSDLADTMQAVAVALRAVETALIAAPGQIADAVVSRLR